MANNLKLLKPKIDVVFQSLFSKQNERITKAFAEALNITDHSFYNWLKGYYNLSHAKAEYLQSIVIEWQE